MYNQAEIKKQIEKSDYGSIFFVSDFASEANNGYISRILSKNMVECGLLHKLSSGIYYKPQITQFGELKPSIYNVVQAIAKRDAALVLPSGDTALYQLGFSTQIPMKHVFLTSGTNRNITIGNHDVAFLHRSPKNFCYKGQLTPMLVQALRTIGKKNITSEYRAHTKMLLKQTIEKNEYEDNIHIPPLWIKHLFVELKKELENENK